MKQIEETNICFIFLLNKDGKIIIRNNKEFDQFFEIAKSLDVISYNEMDMWEKT